MFLKQKWICFPSTILIHNYSPHLSHCAFSQFPHDSLWKRSKILGGRHDIAYDDIDINMPANLHPALSRLPLRSLLLCGVLFNTYITCLAIYLTDRMPEYFLISLAVIKCILPCQTDTLTEKCKTYNRDSFMRMIILPFQKP